ncbi:wax ester/triacylglycerol synthase family O-acyltransferase [Ectothiorhodospiraceae bacterium WFHF3C12]|nr:wax ester/triacylglycerol synthase family O-acyltransferase [Ectothiorhodospiraceae bacterium WFHF3C12]
MAARESMGAVDHAWLRMDRPANLMIITGVLIFREPMDFQRLTHVIETRFLRFHRFRQRVVNYSGTSGTWEDDPNFDIRRHVKRVALPGDAGKVELEDYVSDRMGEPLDHDKPMWEFHLVENYREGAAVVVRIHHCYADGIALIGVTLGITDDEPNPAEPADSPRHFHAHENDVIHALFQPLENAVESTYDLGRGVLNAGLGLARNPRKALAYARYGWRFTTESTELTLLPADSPTRFKGTPGPIKRAVWAEPISLEEVKAIGHAIGCSVNDVLLASVTAALRAYLIEKGDSVEAAEVRAIVPVNMRAEVPGESLGNHFGLVFLSLPVGIANPLERAYELKRRMRELRSSTQPVFALALMNVTGMGPQAFQDFVVGLLSQKASAVMTNVPGPQQPRYLAGVKIDEQMFWVPQSGDIGMGVSIFSYNGRVHFGMSTDAGLVPDPERIIARFGEEFERLVLTTLMEVDWDAPSEGHRPIGPSGR